MPINNTRLEGTFRPLHDGILTRNMKFGMQKTKSGIILPDDDATEAGIHPRWCEVVTVGPEQEDVAPGQWILVAHGRWSRGFELNGEEMRTVDPKDVLMVSDEEPNDEQYGYAK